MSGNEIPQPIELPKAAPPKDPEQFLDAVSSVSPGTNNSNISNNSNVSPESAPVSPEVVMKKTLSDQPNSSKARRFWYFVVYALGYFIGGACSTASVLMLSRIQSQLGVSTSQVSLVYTFTFIGTIVGTLISGFIMDSCCMPRKSHYYAAVIMAFTCLASLVVNDVDSLGLMIVVWSIFGLMIGMTETVSVVYIYRVWTLTGNVMFGKIELFYSLSGAVVAVVIENINIRLFWYLTAGMCAVYVIIIVLLPTPSQKDLVDAIVEEATEEIKKLAKHLSMKNIDIDMDMNEKKTDKLAQNADTHATNDDELEVPPTVLTLQPQSGSAPIPRTRPPAGQTKRKSIKRSLTRTNTILQLNNLEDITVARDPRGAINAASMMGLTMELNDVRNEVSNRLSIMLTAELSNHLSNRYYILVFVLFWCCALIYVMVLCTQSR